MEIGGYYLERTLNRRGIHDLIDYGHVKSRIDKVVAVEIDDEDAYFNYLVSLSEYSFLAFDKDAEFATAGRTSKGDKSFKNLFHYDYSNDVDYRFIYDNLKNPIIRSPVYDQYCKKHKEIQEGMCFDCLERYRVITRNLIPLIKTLRKDLCSIYFVDVLYDLIRFENRDLYAFVTHMINHFDDGSSFKSFVRSFGKKKVRKLLKRMNRPFRRVDFKLILKKFTPLIYAAYSYCVNARMDCLDKVYDYMLREQVSMFKHVASPLVVVGYKANDKYRIDIIESPSVLDFVGEDYMFQIASHPLTESLNFGFYEDRLAVYRFILAIDNQRKKDLRTVYSGFEFSGKSVFTGRLIHSKDAIVIGFLKQSANTFQNFRLDIHIESIVPNRKEVDSMRFITHDKWNFEDNEFDECYA